MLATAAALACFTLPQTALLLAGLFVLTGMALGGFWAPAMAMLSDQAEAGGLEQGFAAALINMAWAAGQTGGAAGGGALAKAAGDGVPMGVAVGLSLATLLATTVRRRRGLAAHHAPLEP
jgi:MFS family permease